MSLSFRWDEHCLGGWCSFFVGFIGKNALAGHREVARWTVFSNAECREPARRPFLFISHILYPFTQILHEIYSKLLIEC